jgi:hypothetical protein
MMQVPEDEFDAAAARVTGTRRAPDVDAAAANVIDGQRVQLRTSLYQSLNTNPDQAARERNLSNKSGIPVDVVQRNFAQVNRNVQLNEFDRVLDRSPLLGQWLSNPNNAKVSHDDTPNLAGIEREFGTIKPIERSFIEGITEPFRRGYAEFKRDFAFMVNQSSLMKGLQSRQQAAAEANGISFDPKIQQKLSIQNYQRNVEKFPIPEDIQRGLTEISEASTFSEGMSAILSNPFALKEAAIQSFGKYSPVIAMAIATKNVGPMGASTTVPFFSQQAIRQGLTLGTGAYFLEYAGTMDEVIQSRAGQINSSDALYQVLSDEKIMEEARDKAVRRGVPIAFWTALTAGLAGKLLSGAKPTVASVATRVTGEATIQAAGGAAGEASAQALTNEFKPGEILLEAILELPSALVEIPGNYKSTMLQAESAERSAKAFEKVQEFSRASKVRARSAETFNEWISQVTQETDVTTVYISGETLKQSGLAERVAEVSPSVRDQIDTAIATGGDIAIPVTEYQTNIAPTEFSTALIDDLRIEGETMTRREARQFIDNQAEIMKTEMEANAKVEMTNKEFVKSARQVQNTMFQQLKATKQYTDNAARINAQLVRDFVVTQAASLKIMPTEFYDRYMYKVERADGQAGGMALFNQDQTVNTTSDAFRNWIGASMFQDQQGRPQTLYHGTADDVTAFDPDHPNRKDTGWLGTGVYLTDSIDMADVYADQKARKFGPAGQNIMPLYARLENPYMATMEDKARIRAGGREAADAFTAELQAQGYDGVILEVAPDAREIVVFDPAAVKSPFNDGTWSRENADILRQGDMPPAQQTESLTDSDTINAAEDAEGDDVAAIEAQADIPETVEDQAELKNALEVAKSQVWNKGRDLKLAIQKAVQEAAGAAGVDVSVPSPQTTDYLVRVGLKDALFALEQNPNAIGWYDEKTRQALAVMALVHPEIATNEDARFAFTWALAVTSNGLKVDKNFELAEKAYRYYKENKVMPTNIKGGQAQNAINDSLALFNKLVDEWGMKNLRQFMQTNFTVGEISAINKELKPGGEHADTVVKGSAIIGPKIGNGFFSNLYGDFSSLTMDRWLIRTWGRWTGTLIKSQQNNIQKATERLGAVLRSATPEQAKSLSAVIGMDIANTEINRLADAIQKASMDPKLREQMNESKVGEEIRKAGNSLAKYNDGQKEAPAGPHERTYIRSVFAQILAELQADPAYADLTMADLQAVLWYAEKRLYESAKDNNVDQESTDGYSDEDAPDYANAAAGVARDLGISDRKINNALKKESKDERARRARLQDEQDEITGGEQAESGGFTQREKRLFAGAVATQIARSNRSGDQKQSWSYTAKSSGDGGKVRVLKKLLVTYSQEWKAGAGLARVYRNNGITVPKFYELEQGNAQNAQRFSEAITASKQASGDMGAAVYVYPVEDYQGMRLFLAEDGLSGVAVKPDGDIVSVFSQGGAGRSVMELAVAAGGTRLDAFETILPEFYAAHGFVASSRLPWDDTQAPEGWNKEAFAEFNNGEPNVVFMALDQSYYGWHQITDGKKAKTYDDAVAEQNRAVKRNKKRKEDHGKPAVFAQSGAGGGGVQRLRASDLNVAQRYGTARDGATSVLGIHYSKQPRNNLAGFAYGTGLKGAEAGRLAGADTRLSNRIHFYVDTGNGIRPEAGVGGNVHAVYLDNLYNAATDPLGLRAQASAMGRDDRGQWFNAVESAIIDAGFDGVYIPAAQGDQGVAVLLGPKHTGVPVEQHGMHSMPAAGAYTPPAGTKRRYAMLTSEIRKFEAQEAEIKAAAPSAELRSGTLTFEDADAEAVAKFFPPAAKSQILRQPERGGFDPKRLTTILNEGADMSTFLHETAHFFLTVYADMASRPDATEQNKEDMQTILDWFGVKDLATWNALSLDEQRKYHEAWAYNYEIYLFEGKAPSERMRSIFQKFSDWIKSVYTSIREELNEIYRKENGEDLPILTGEVRQVMDRMIASDAQIKQSEAVNSMVPMFQTQEESGMDDTEWAAYQAMMAEATEASITELTQASLRQLKWLGNARSRVLKEMQAKTADIRKGVREEVAAEVQNDSVYRAMEFLKRGTLKDEDGNDIESLGGHKLKIADVKALYPESKETLTPAPDLAKLGYGKYGMLAEEGMPPDLVASMFGFASGDQLVRSLLEAKPIKEEIDNRTDARMLDEYADLMNPAAIELEVQKALHNDARARFVAVELRYLAKATQPARLMIQAAKTAAKSLIGNKVISEIRPRDYALAEARASKESIKASKAGKTTEAARAKQNQLLNNQLTLEAVNARKEIDKAIEGFAKIFKADAKMAKNRNIDLVNAARFILGHYGLGPRDVEPGKFVEQLKAYNPDLFADIEPILLEATGGPRNYKKLTLNQFRDMKEIVDALWFQSKRDNEVMIEGKAVALDSIIGELTTRLEAIGVPLEVAGERMAPGKKEKAIRALYNAKALTRRVEHWADATDGAAGPGAFTNYIWRPVRAALDQYRVDRNRYVKDYVDMIQKLDLPVAKISAPELNYTFGNENGGIGKAEVLGALMHIGNDSNMKKLLVGRGWGTANEDGTVDTSRWNMFMNRMIDEGVLTKADFDFVQAVWDLNEEIKPMAQEAHREIFGYYFKEVEARSVVTPFGTYRGGYVPAKTDPFIVRDAQRQAKMEELEADFRNAMPSTGAGFTMGRVEYNKPLSLDIRVMAKHIDDVIRFARVQPTIRDTLKILRKRDFADTLTRIDPTVIEDMLIPWLNRSARQITSEAGMNKSIDTFWRAVRNRTGIGIMFGNITNALQQATGFFTSLIKVQGKYLKTALVDYMKSPTAQAEFVAELSPFMADRMSNQMVEVQDLMNDLLLNPTKFEKVQKWSNKHGYFLQQAFQNFVDIVTWVGAYNQAVAEAGVDVSEEAASKEAIKRADAAVRMTQSSLQPEDLSAFEVGSPFYKTLIQFSGYFNMMANLNATEYIKIFRDLGWRGNKGKLFMQYLLGFGLPMLVADAIVRSLGGGWDDEDDDGYLDVFMSWFFGSQARGAVALVPFGTAATVPFNAFNNKPYDDRMTTSPSVSTLEGATIGVVKAGINIADSDKEVTGKNVRDILTMISLVTGIPVTVLGRPIGYAIDVERGEIKPTSDVDYVRGLATGKASESSRQ